jgi:hypothetical protein
MTGAASSGAFYTYVYAVPDILWSTVEARENGVQKAMRGLEALVELIQQIDPDIQVNARKADKSRPVVTVHEGTWSLVVCTTKDNHERIAGLFSTVRRLVGVDRVEQDQEICSTAPQGSAAIKNSSTE